LGDAEIFKNYLFEMLKFKLITRDREFFFFGEPRTFLLQASAPLETKYPTIDNIFLSYNLLKYWVSPFLPKKN
jgi:hypothetical protein